MLKKAFGQATIFRWKAGKAFGQMAFLQRNVEKAFGKTLFFKVKLHFFEKAFNSSSYKRTFV
jgi:hypothetical protein